MPSTLLIANPAARNGQGAQAAKAAARLLGEGRGGLQVALTERAGHATALAAAAGSFGTVVALGGDGVVNEVVNGLMRLPQADRPALGVLPVGSGNDYASSLGMSADLEAAAAQLQRCPRRQADVGECNGRFFAETLSFGLDAGIALDTVERRRRTKATGALLYMQSGLDQLLHHLDFHDVQISFDGAKPRSERIVLCAIQVGPTYGGGFRICPDARFDDGLFDVCIAHAPVGALKAGYVFLRAKRGNHTRYREIELARARSASLSFTHPLPVQMDGERMEGTEFSVRLHPGALRVIAPDPAAFRQDAPAR